MTFLNQGKSYLSSNKFKTSLRLIENIVSNNGVLEIHPAISTMLQIDLSDILEKQEVLTEMYQFFLDKVISLEGFDIMTKGKFGLFPKKVLLGTKDGFIACGIYNDKTHTVNMGAESFSIKLPEYLDNCVISLDVLQN